MELIADVTLSGTKVLEDYAFASRKTFPEVLRQGGRGAIRYLYAITPPASASGIAFNLDGTSEARRRGYATIERDMNKIFVPVRLKGKRKEQHSLEDMQRIHNKHLQYKRPGAKMRRYGPPNYVDRRKFNQMVTTLRSHVGRLASGWNAAGLALGITPPSWIGRHGTSRGTFQAEYNGDLLYIESVNLASPHAPVEELRRRVPYAVRYAMNDMHRQTVFLMQRNAGFLGLRTTGFTGPG